MIDIIIPTTFEPDLAYGCVQSILNNIKDVKYEITVVDNLSSPVFSMESCKIRRFEKQLGFAKVMNEGIQNTKGDYVLLLNNDTLIQQPNFLSNLIQTIDSEPNVGIVSPMTNFICTAQARAQDLNSITNQVIDHPHHIAAVCWLLKRETINKIGMFDENFKIGAFEDGDYCQRILNAGYKIKIDGRSFLFHYGSRTVSKTFGYYEAFQENSNYYHTKWNIK